MAPEKRQTNRKKGRTNRKKGRVREASKTPQTRMDKGFPAPLACAREKTRKNYKKTGVKNPGLWVTRKAPLHSAPALRVGKGGCAANTPERYARGHRYRGGG